MDVEKRNTIILSAALVCSIGALVYSYFLSTDIESTNQKIASLEQLRASNRPDGPSQGPSQGASSKFKITVKCKKVSKKVDKTEEEFQAEVEKMKRLGREAKDASKVKIISEDVCSPIRYCDVSNVLNSLSFTKKEFQTAIAELPPQKGTYLFDKNSIFIMPSKTSQQELAIRAWDDKFNVVEFEHNGKFYNSSVCKTPEQEQEERDRILAEQYNKEAAEKAKIAAEKLEKEKLEQERLERKRLDEERLERERLEKEKLQEVISKMQKIENEKKLKEQEEQNRIEKERLEKEKLEQEQMKKVKTKIKSF